MEGGDRQTLDIPDFDAPQPESKNDANPADDLGDFEPRAGASDTQETVKKIASVSSFPSREASAEGQLSIKSPDKRILDRFKAMCKADRRAYYDMLEILMDSFEGKGQGS